MLELVFPCFEAQKAVFSLCADTEAQIMTDPAEMTGWEAQGPKVKELNQQPLALKWRAGKCSVQNVLFENHF